MSKETVEYEGKTYRKLEYHEKPTKGDLQVSGEATYLIVYNYRNPAGELSCDYYRLVEQHELHEITVQLTEDELDLLDGYQPNHPIMVKLHAATAKRAELKNATRRAELEAELNIARSARAAAAQEMRRQTSNVESIKRQLLEEL